MNNIKNTTPSPPYLDPGATAFIKKAESDIYGSATPTGNSCNHYHQRDHDHFNVQQMLTFGERVASANTVPPATNSAVRVQSPAIATSVQATLNMNLWLQQNNPSLLAQLSQQSNIQVPGSAHTNISPHALTSTAKASPPVSMPDPPGSAPASNPLLQAPPINEDYARIAKQLKHYSLQLTDQLSSANQQLRSSHDTITDLKYQLNEQERTQDYLSPRFAAVGSERSNVKSSIFGQAATRPFISAMITPPPTQGLSPKRALGPPSTPTNTRRPPTLRTPPNRSSRRHHRTATPEQRSIRAMMGNKPVFTVGIDPQNDRCLLYDFFEHIKQWTTTYTVHIRSLNAEQVHNLSAHSAIAGSLGKPSQLMTRVTEKDMLIAMVTGVISRHMWTYALDEHSIYASGHPQAEICEELAWKWTTIPFEDHEAKHDLLLAQQQIYTAIKNAPDHKSWRASCAERLTIKLLSDLTGLLATNLSPSALQERNHILSELTVKGYRIGFRLRMAATKWQFQWPSAGTEFNPGTMVNESRTLYGDVMRTMGEVMRDPRAHEVLFAVSPTVTRSDFSMGSEQRVVVHNALVHITRKGYA